MGNDVEPEDNPVEAPRIPLLILAADEDSVCIDDLCLPADVRDARDPSDEREATAE